jgi:Zn-dependent protease/CBS domain-containing protein
MRSRVQLGRLFGISLGFDLSWLIVALLVTWSLATEYFPSILPELTPEGAWLLGAASALGLFGSVLFHELAHALAARQFGVATRRITLFIFGGVAELDDEPPTPLAEFVIALAGPAASLLAMGGSLLLAPFFLALSGSIPASMAILWVGRMNLMLALFNLVPAFPLDGGRVLRSILWWWRKDLLGATRISSLLGQVFAFTLIGLGVLRILSSGNIADGVWLCLIGLFVRNAARTAYQQVAWRQLLAGEPVSQFMRTNPVVVPRHISIDELMHSYVPLHKLATFPVVDDQRLLGLVDAQAAARTPRAEWQRQSVGTLTEPCSEINTVAPETDALDALARMRRSGLGRLLVVSGDRLVGTLTLADLLHRLVPKPS